MADLTYTQDKMFTRFYAENAQGENAWREMASKMDGVAAVFNFEAQAVIQQLKKAGYKIAKAKSSTQTMSQILNELGI